MIKRYKILTISCMLMFLATSIAFAQQDPEAKKILDKASQKYKSMKAYKVNFTSKLKKVTGGVETIKGEIIIKGNKFHLKMPDQIIINNGKYVWTYLDEEVTRSKYSSSNDEITPDKIADIYKKGYKYAFTHKNLIEGNRSFYEIMLVPLKRESNITNIIVSIAKDNHTIKKWEITQRDGNKYFFIADRIATLVNLKDSYFQYKASKFPSGHAYIKLD